MTVEPATKDAMLKAIPSLRAFAVSLCGNVDRADDLVQEALTRALASIDSFRPGSNMSAWLFTILRNHFRSEYRKRRREVEDPDGWYAGRLTQEPEQEHHLEYEDLRAAMAQLSDEQREALILVGASGFTCEEAADICHCAVGTIKSRVSRARGRLAEMLAMKDVRYPPREPSRGHRHRLITLDSVRRPQPPSSPHAPIHGAPG